MERGELRKFSILNIADGTNIRIKYIRIPTMLDVLTQIIAKQYNLLSMILITQIRWGDYYVRVVD
jgi:hypothetical protein